MARYRLCGDYVYSEDIHTPLKQTADVVSDPDDSPVNTGLVDSMGRTIYRCSDRVPLGFFPARGGHAGTKRTR